MIDEAYLKSAISIRREYLKISNNLDLYRKRSSDLINMLEKYIVELEEIDKNIKKNKNYPANKSLNDILKVINNIEEEGKRLEEFTKPMNEKMEKLAKEERELYTQLLSKYSNLKEEQIVNIVRDRLLKEGLISKN